MKKIIFQIAVFILVVGIFSPDTFHRLSLDTAGTSSHILEQGIVFTEVPEELKSPAAVRTEARWQENMVKLKQWWAALQSWDACEEQSDPFASSFWEQYMANSGKDWRSYKARVGQDLDQTVRKNCR